MKIKIIKRKGLFKKFEASLDMGTFYLEDSKIYIKQICNLLKQWENEARTKQRKKK